MGKGRKRHSTAQKLREGKPICQDRSAEPQPRAGEPVCPAAIKEDSIAWAKWCELVVLLDDMGILTQAEGNILEQMCRAYAVMVRAKESIDKLGMVIEIMNERSISHKRNPACQEYWAACDMIRKLMPELGLTPSGRAKLKTADKPNEDDNPLVTLAKIA